MRAEVQIISKFPSCIQMQRLVDFLKTVKLKFLYVKHDSPVCMLTRTPCTSELLCAIPEQKPTKHECSLF